MKSVSTGTPWTKDLLGIFKQPQLLVPSQTNQPSPLKARSPPLSTTMEELAEPLALVVELTVARDKDKDVLVGD